MPSFRAFTTKYEAVTNRIITEAKITDAFDPANPPASITHHSTGALWDTGATRSVISSNVVAALGLQPVGICDVNHAGGVSQSATYVVNVLLPNKVAVVGVLVTELTKPISGFDVIIGMDIITSGDFAVTHTAGKTCMSFRIPPCEQIDYVADAQRIMTEKTLPISSEKVVGRNSPCPCGKKQPNGKGVKYKNCHGA